MSSAFGAHASTFFIFKFVFTAGAYFVHFILADFIELKTAVDGFYTFFFDLWTAVAHVIITILGRMAGMIFRLLVIAFRIILLMVGVATFLIHSQTPS